MPYLLVRQRFVDYERWREVFDSITPLRDEAGMRLVLVSRNAAEPDEAVVLFEVADVERAREHALSPALRDAHERAGVVEGSNSMTLLDAVD
ncbi:hypothetical protein [Nocardiopsis aegyptia]|uniref:Antibiotic biosynthesis monooxygenase n=1 Tax=Nocardiopsis aegyptia TaxID=220378 RepID=A0A7Z0JAI1_9ACTN|nr:hypothetical protein [Nocardiopsis aegyptia]NYJ34802.1 hypothetical protein [Nocardiopsis aegyptia]